MDLEFGEPFTWSARSVLIGMDFAPDEAVEATASSMPLRQMIQGAWVVPQGRKHYP